MLHAPREIRDGAAGVGQEHVQPREPIEDAAQDEMSGRNGGVERVAEQVAQVERLQPVVGPDHGERVQEHGQLELLTALEDRRERRVREIAARDVGAHVDGADAGQAGRPLELADRGWRLLHWQRRTADEPVRKRGMRFGQALVEGVGQAPPEFPFGEVRHRRRQRQGLKADPRAIHRLDSRVDVPVGRAQRRGRAAADHDRRPLGIRPIDACAHRGAVGLDQLQETLGKEVAVDVDRRG